MSFVTLNSTWYRRESLKLRRYLYVQIRFVYRPISTNTVMRVFKAVAFCGLKSHRTIYCGVLLCCPMLQTPEHQYHGKCLFHKLQFRR